MKLFFTILGIRVKKKANYGLPNFTHEISIRYVQSCSQEIISLTAAVWIFWSWHLDRNPKSHHESHRHLRLSYSQWIPAVLRAYLECSLLNYSAYCPCHFQSHVTTLLLQRPGELGDHSVPQSCGFRCRQHRRKGILSRNSWCNSPGTLLSSGVLSSCFVYNIMFQTLKHYLTAQVWHRYLWFCGKTSTTVCRNYKRSTKIRDLGRFKMVLPWKWTTRNPLRKDVQWKRDFFNENQNPVSYWSKTPQICLATWTPASLYCPPSSFTGILPLRASSSRATLLTLKGKTEVKVL